MRRSAPAGSSLPGSRIQSRVVLQVLKLSTALASLDTCIQDHVSSHYSDLLSRAVASSDLESSLGVMATHIGSLQMSTDRLRARVSDPYDKIAAGTASLSRLQETTDILR